jgi:chromosomal replication initiation ATPase DnaA
MITPDDIVLIVSKESQVPVEVLKDVTNRMPVVYSARAKAMHMMRERCYMSQSRIAKYFSVNIKAVQYACRRK